MSFEKLKRSHLKRNIVIGVAGITIISTIVLNFTKAKYRVTQSIPLASGTINYNLADLNVIALFQESESGQYQEINIMPSSGYTINEEKSYCEVNGVKDSNAKLYTNSEQEHVIANLQKGTKCYLYFDEKVLAKDTILSNYSTRLTRTDFTTTVTNTTTGTIYKSKDSSQYDDDGEVYYFAGNPTDNWVYFGGFYWRIIRINGDGSLRLIYSGNSTSGPSTNGKDTQIGTSAFNSLKGNNAYLGYMYTLEQTHGLNTSSTIKGVLDNWYQSNLNTYTNNINENAGFCGDRSSYTNNSGSSSGGGVGTTNTYYGAYIRLITNKEPSFDCPNNSDLYTTDNSNKGNKSLIYPIGLISADEVAYAGGKEGSTNSQYYLYTAENYWTISPQNGGKYNYPFAVHSNGFLGDLGQQNSGNGVRPVINLKASVTISSGNGTSSNPYTIS